MRKWKTLVGLIALGSALIVADASLAGKDDGASDRDIGKIRYALSCGAKFGSVEDASATDRHAGPNGYVIQGFYRQKFNVGLKFGPFSQGEGSEYTGVFIADFDRAGHLRRLQWKIGVKAGESPPQCLG